MSAMVAACGAAVLGVGARWVGESYTRALFADAPRTRPRPLVMDMAMLVMASALAAGSVQLLAPERIAVAWPVAAFATTAAAAALIDARTGYLPDLLTLPLLILGTAGPALTGESFPQTTDAAVLGASLAFGVFVLTGAVVELGLGRAGLNGGDVKFAVAIGAWTGPAGVLPALLIGSLAMALYGLVRQAIAGGDGTVRFGPHLALGGIAMVVVGLFA